MLLLLKLLCIFLVVTTSSASVQIDTDGGYTNVVVGLHPDVPDSKIEPLFIELEELFKTASRSLKEASKGTLFFKEIIFAVPKKYYLASKTRNWESGSHYFHNPDIRITTNDVFKKAYAVQNNGCGKPALRIHVPHDLNFKVGNTKGKDLIRAWVKYRYGVFDESGFVGDDLYPACYTIPGTNTTKVTDCTNNKGSYDIRGQNSQQCNPVPKYGRNQGITSSLMTSLDFPNNKFFCDDDKFPHNKDAPSKQNNLCKEQSTWKVISQHEDFKLKRKPTNSANIKFKYVMESDENLIFAVDSSIEMSSYDRLDMVRNAFSYFILYNLPTPARVGLVSLKDIADDSLLVKVETQSDAERLIDVFPDSDEANSVCVHCGIQKALKILKNNTGASHGNIVIATAKDIDEPYVKHVIEELSNNYINLHIIYFNSKIKEPPLLQKLVSNGRGNLFYVSDNYKSGNNAPSLTQVYEAFRTISESLSWMNTKYVLLKQETFFHGHCSTCEMTFSIDESLESFQMLLTGPDFLRTSPVAKNTFNLRSLNQTFSFVHPSFSYKIKIPAYTFNVENPETGLWSVSFQRKGDSRKPIVLIVRGYNSNPNDVIQMKSWIEYNMGADEIVLNKPPFTLYTEVKKGNFAIHNASVTAILHEVSTGKEITLHLFDNGDGDPDITRNDGIFSRYFVQAPSRGYYILTTKLEAGSYVVGEKLNAQEAEAGYCCGSSYPSTALHDSELLIRTETRGSIFINEQNVGVSLAPRRINDFRVEKLVTLENGIKCFALKWTSPGNNYDYGTANSYQLRIFNSKENAQKNFGSAYIIELDEWYIHGDMLIPQEPGTSENVLVELKNLDTGTYYLALRTIGSSGQSDISNILEIFHSKPIITPTSILSTTDNSRTGSPVIDKDSSYKRTILSVSVAGAFLFICIVIGIIIFFYLRKRQKLEEKHEDESSKQATESNGVLCHNKNDANTSVISPVNSWPANSLLSHYETQRIRKPDVCNVPIVLKESEDSVSTVSSKYSYTTKCHTNPSFYEYGYFPNSDKDDINYPFNSNYDQFHPTYTSSLRRFPNQITTTPLSPMGLSYSNTLDNRSISRLRTDV